MSSIRGQPIVRGYMSHWILNVISELNFLLPTHYSFKNFDSQENNADNESIIN